MIPRDEIEAFKECAHPVRDYALLIVIEELIELRSRMYGIEKLHRKDDTTDAAVREIVTLWADERNDWMRGARRQR